MTRKQTRSRPKNRSQNWRKDMQRVTPEQLAKALLKVDWADGRPAAKARMSLHQ